MVKHSPKKITSLHHPLVKHLVKLRESSAYREESQTVLIPGRTLVLEISKILTPLTLVIADEIPFDIPATHCVTKEIVKKITALPNPEGVVAEFPLPKPSSLEGASFVLILDQVTDPGNMGTLLRTALAFGWEGVFFLPGCVDPFNEKVIRSSRAACFRLSFREGTWDELLELAQKNKTMLFLADIEGKSIQDFSNFSSAFLIMSNEAHGSSKTAQECATKITIPMPGQMESLNVAVAGGILMYCLRGI